MDAKRLAKYRQRLYTKPPLIGGWLWRKAVETLAADGSPEAVRELAEAVARGNDEQEQGEMLAALKRLTAQRGIDAVCEVWTSTRHAKLAKLLAERGWVASAPVRLRVLSALKVGRLEVATEGGAKVIEPLLQACEDVDPVIAKHARLVLQQLKSVDAREALCSLFIEHDHRIAREAAVAAQYAPRDAHRRALFYFLTEQWEKYESLDFDYTFLREAYETGDVQLRGRIAQQARQAGRVEWIEVVTGGRQKRRLGEMTDEEWNAALAVLFAGRRWDELWRLAQDAPPRWGAQILQQMNENEWALSGANEKEECEQLVRLAIRWKESGLRSLTDFKATLEDSSGYVTCLVFSPDGRLLVSSGGTYGEIVRLWNLPDGKLIKKLEGHRHVRCLAISPDGRLLASGSSDVIGSSDEPVRLRRLPDGFHLKTLEGYRRGNVSCLTIGPDGRLLASGSQDKTVRLWSMPDGKLIKTLEGHQHGVSCLTISPDGRLLASGSHDKTVRLWDLPDGKLIKKLEGHQGWVRCLAISPDGRLLASGSDDKTVRLWDLPNGLPVRALGHESPVMCLAISPDGRLLASGSTDKNGTVWLRSLPNGELRKTQSGGRGLAFSPNGRMLATGKVDGYPGDIALWTLHPIHLSYLPIALASREDFEWVQETLRDGKIAESARRVLEFIAALMQLRQRYDIVVEEATRRIEVGEFDIEIEG